MQNSDAMAFRAQGISLPLAPGAQRIYDELSKELDGQPLPEATLVFIPVLGRLLKDLIEDLPPMESAVDPDDEADPEPAANPPK